MVTRNTIPVNVNSTLAMMPMPSQSHDEIPLSRDRRSAMRAPPRFEVSAFIVRITSHSLACIIGSLNQLFELLWRQG